MKIVNGKEYNEKDIRIGCSIEDAVNTLLECNVKGELAYVDFNGVKLYSDSVTMDGAYKNITGKTKAEYDHERKEWLDDYRRREEEHKNNIPKLIVKWRNKGKEVLSEDKWEEWNEIVPIRLSDLYRGMELGSCLDLVKCLNENEDLEEAKNMIYKQGHSGMSFGLVCSMVKEFSDRGEEFVKYVR